jgi:hypothetical protein
LQLLIKPVSEAVVLKDPKEKSDDEENQSERDAVAQNSSCGSIPNGFPQISYPGDDTAFWNVSASDVRIREMR